VSLVDLILMFAVVIPTVCLSLWWLLRPVQTMPEQPSEEHPAILFNDGILEHASDAALERFPLVLGSHSWEDLRDIFLPQYPNFPETPMQVGAGRTSLPSIDNTELLQISWFERGASLTFMPSNVEPACPSVLEELKTLRQVNENLPHPIWKTDASGAIVWTNEAYAQLAVRLRPDDADDTTPVFPHRDNAASRSGARIKLDMPDTNTSEWYSVSRCQLSQGAIYHATSLTALIKAEEAQRDFVQTLAKTFAHLSIGLAIFNRDRQLALFNPALTDLTGLPATFLSPRPTIDMFFDTLRENRRMPEPKNYKTWRQRMVELVSAAETGRFEETWSLETGQTYRVKGRPHPDGAIAFLIEDISAEISLTRNFRAELELGQNLVDTFEDALAVFSQSGTLTFSNKAYDLLWGCETHSTFADITIKDAVTLWKEKTLPNPMWTDLQEAVMTLEDREPWTMPVCLQGQKPILCKVVPIASGATVVRFSCAPAQALDAPRDMDQARS